LICALYIEHVVLLNCKNLVADRTERSKPNPNGSADIQPQPSGLPCSRQPTRPATRIGPTRSLSLPAPVIAETFSLVTLVRCRLAHEDSEIPH